MQIVIFGANGSTGRLLTRRVLDAGHSAVAVTRRPNDFPITDPRLTIAGADVRSDGLAGIVAGADAVLSTLGVPFTRQPVDTYSVGTRNVVNAMRETGVNRLVVVSSLVPTLRPARAMRHCCYGCLSRSSPAPSARRSTTISGRWKRWCARAAWAGRSCVRRGYSIYLKVRIMLLEKRIRSAHSRPASTWRTTSSNLPKTGRQEGIPLSSPQPSTRRLCGK